MYSIFAFSSPLDLPVSVELPISLDISFYKYFESQCSVVYRMQDYGPRNLASNPHFSNEGVSLMGDLILGVSLQWPLAHSDSGQLYPPFKKVALLENCHLDTKNRCSNAGIQRSMSSRDVTRHGPTTKCHYTPSIVISLSWYCKATILSLWVGWGSRP